MRIEHLELNIRILLNLIVLKDIFSVNVIIYDYYFLIMRCYYFFFST